MYITSFSLSLLLLGTSATAKSFHSEAERHDSRITKHDHSRRPHPTDISSSRPEDESRSWSSDDLPSTSWSDKDHGKKSKSRFEKGHGQKTKSRSEKGHGKKTKNSHHGRPKQPETSSDDQGQETSMTQEPSVTQEPASTTLVHGHAHESSEPEDSSHHGHHHGGRAKRAAPAKSSAKSSSRAISHTTSHAKPSKSGHSTKSTSQVRPTTKPISSKNASTKSIIKSSGSKSATIITITPSSSSTVPNKSSSRVSSSSKSVTSSHPTSSHSSHSVASATHSAHSESKSVTHTKSESHSSLSHTSTHSSKPASTSAISAVNATIIKFHVEAVSGTFNGSLLETDVSTGKQGFKLGDQPASFYRLNTKSLRVHTANSKKVLVVEGNSSDGTIVAKNVGTIVATDSYLRCRVHNGTSTLSCTAQHKALSAFHLVDNKFLALSANKPTGHLKLKAVVLT